MSVGLPSRACSPVTSPSQVSGQLTRGDEGDEGRRHGADVEGQAQAVAGTGRRGIDDVVAGLLDFHLDHATGQRRATSGTSSGQPTTMVAGAAMIEAASRCLA